MHQRIDPEALLNRTREFHYNAAIQTASLVMSGLLVLAGLQLVEIIKAQDEVPVRLALWLFTTFNASVGFRFQAQIAITSTSNHPIDFSALFLLFGLINVLMFALLVPIAGIEHSWKWWFVASACYAIYGTLGMASIVILVPIHRITGWMTPELAGIATEMRGQIVRRFQASLVLAALSISVSALAWFHAGTDWMSWLIYIWLTLNVAVLIVAYRRLKQTLLRCDELALQAIEARKSPGQ